MHALKNSLIILLLTVLTSCSKENEAPSTTSIMTQGKWRISLYSDNGANKTNNYSGYEFTFKNNNTVTATKGTTNANGTWNAGPDENLNKFLLNFSSSALSDLNADWLFVTKSYSVVKLESVTNTGTDILVLERI